MIRQRVQKTPHSFILISTLMPYTTGTLCVIVDYKVRFVGFSGSLIVTTSTGKVYRSLYWGATRFYYQPLSPQPVYTTLLSFFTSYKQSMLQKIKKGV
jgi:hypothetical protein